MAKPPKHTVGARRSSRMSYVWYIKKPTYNNIRLRVFASTLKLEDNKKTDVEAAPRAV
jgi:hypothetical protein